MKQKRDVQQGTLALMVLKTLQVLGPLHGYGIARRIAQISDQLLSVNQGTLYPILLRLEQEGAVASKWGPSENNRRARFYRLTRAGKKLLGGGFGMRILNRPVQVMVELRKEASANLAVGRGSPPVSHTFSMPRSTKMHRPAHVIRDRQLGILCTLIPSAAIDAE